MRKFNFKVDYIKGEQIWQKWKYAVVNHFTEEFSWTQGDQFNIYKNINTEKVLIYLKQAELNLVL